MDKDILLVPTNRDALLVSIDRVVLPIQKNKDILLAIAEKQALTSINTNVLLVIVDKRSWFVLLLDIFAKVFFFIFNFVLLLNLGD